MECHPAQTLVAPVGSYGLTRMNLQDEYAFIPSLQQYYPIKCVQWISIWLYDIFLHICVAHVATGWHRKLLPQ